MVDTPDSAKRLTTSSAMPSCVNEAPVPSAWPHSNRLSGRDSRRAGDVSAFGTRGRGASREALPGSVQLLLRLLRFLLLELVREYVEIHTPHLGAVSLRAAAAVVLPRVLLVL